jgi:two-component system sensor histidine kinase UhpB
MPEQSLNDRFLRVIESARDIIGLYDTDGTQLYVNGLGREYVEASAEDASADPFMRVHPHDRDRIRAEFAEIVRSGEPRRLEFRSQTRDGSIRLMESEANPVRDASGKVCAILGIARNVTEERRIRAALRATIETLFDQVPVGIAITDLEGHFVSLNRRMREMLGYGYEALLKLNIWDVTHPLDRPAIDVKLADLIAGRIDRFSMEKRYVGANGEVRWVTCSAAMVHPPLGGPKFTIEIADDITERKRINEALREREELLEAIFEHAPIGIAITDMDARYVRANRRFLQMLGYTEEELYRLTGWDVAYAGDIELNRKLREELFAGEREDYSWERRYVRKNGEVLWTGNTVALIRDGAGAPRYAIALVEDISQRKLDHAAIHATAERLQALTRRLVEVQEGERRDLARELHDRVGQTLTAMHINMDMIRTRLAEHDDPLIRSRNDDSIELIDAAFKAVENVMYELRPPMIDEHGLVAPLQWYARKFTERTGVRVEVRGDECWRCGPEVELALFRIAQEALNNVARHAQASNVAIDLREIGPDIVLTIEDDGVGFDRDADRTGEAGYGLVTMDERSEGVGGAFEAHSEKGRGTRITVRVPRRK